MSHWFSTRAMARMEEEKEYPMQVATLIANLKVIMDKRGTDVEVSALFPIDRTLRERNICDVVFSAETGRIFLLCTETDNGKKE